MKTHAKRSGQDWILNGAKMWITNGAIAGLAVVWAMTEEGIRGFLVEKGTPGSWGLEGPAVLPHPGPLWHRLGVIGAAQACLSQLLEYTADRVLFGRTLAHNQAIQILLAEMARQITTAQVLALQLGAPEGLRPDDPYARLLGQVEQLPHGLRSRP